MQDQKKRYVIPGDVITSGPYRPEQHVTMDGEKIIATTVGISDISEDSVRVIPLTGMYIPKDNEISMFYFQIIKVVIDIYSCSSAPDHVIS